MKRMLIAGTFPYLVPSICLGFLAYAYDLVVPSPPSAGTGPGASSELGLFFIGATIIFGGALQLIMGLPLNLILALVQSFGLRLIACILGTLIPSIVITIRITSDDPFGAPAIFSITILVLMFGIGSWVAFRQLSLNSKESDKPVDATASSPVVSSESTAPTHHI